MMLEPFFLLDRPVALALALLTVLLLHSLGKAWLHYLQHKRPFPGVPMAKGSNFLFGHFGAVTKKGSFQESSRILEVDSANEFGQTGFWVFHLPFLSVNSVIDARTVLNNEHERQPPTLFKHFSKNFLGEKNLLTINGREWKFHRGAVARTFNPKFLIGQRARMELAATTMVASLQDRVRQAPVDTVEMNVEPLMKMITLDAFGQIALSTDLGLCRTLEQSPLVKAFEYLLNTTMARMRAPYRPRNLFYCLPFQQNHIHRRERQLVRTFLTDLINNKKESLGGEDNDLLSHLIRAHENSPGDLKPEDVANEAMTDVLMTLLFAGYDTTSVTLAFTLYLLSQNQDAQQCCVNEINAIQSAQNVEELVYCKAVIWEALRLFPAAVRSTRTLTKDIPLQGGFTAPAGTRVVIPIFNIHRNEKFFPAAEKFLPDRWAKQSDDSLWVERNDDDHSSSTPVGDRKAMLAFSAGGRNCVGQKFAIQEAVIVLATLLRGLKFTPKEGYKLEVTGEDFILKPRYGMPLNVEMRA